MDSLRLFRQFFLILTLIFGVSAWQGVAYAEDNSAIPSSVNINSASAEDIAAVLNGVGEKRAQAIVEYRKDKGPFKSLEDLLKVKGVGQKVLDKNASKITLQVVTKETGRFWPVSCMK